MDIIKVIGIAFLTLIFTIILNIFYWVIINMKDKFKKCLKIVFPFKKINFFVLSLFLLGLILGAVFSTTISINDRNLVIEQITTFINNSAAIISILIFVRFIKNIMPSVAKLIKK